FMVMVAVALSSPSLTSTVMLCCALVAKSRDLPCANVSAPLDVMAKRSSSLVLMLKVSASLSASLAVTVPMASAGVMSSLTVNSCAMITGAAFLGGVGASSLPQDQSRAVAIRAIPNFFMMFFILNLFLLLE